MSLAHFRKTRRPARPWLEATDANSITATQVAALLGTSIETQGRHCKLGDGTRGTLIDGRMVWCTKGGTGIGDNIALAQLFTGLGFRPALEMLLSQPAATIVQQIKTRPVRPMRLPMGGEADRLAGGIYLLGRGIAQGIIDHAEACGMLKFIPGALLFVGYDDLRPMSATRRGFLPDDMHPKRDLFGSNKEYPAVLPGDNKTIWIVEGGVDALAVHMLEPVPPTAIVSGGAGCRSWVGTRHIASLLMAAERVVVACDNENSSEKQNRTNDQHQQQANLIQRHCNAVSLWHPPSDYKDLGELAERGILLAASSLCQHSPATGIKH